MRLKSNGKQERKRSKFLFYLKMISVLVVLVAIGATILLFERERPLITLLDDVSLLGNRGDFSFSVVDEKSGVQWLDVAFRQGEKVVTVLSRSFPRAGYFAHSGPNRLEEKVSVKGAALGLHDGTLELIITVRDFSFWNWMLGNEAVYTSSLILDTMPPQVMVLDSPRYIKQGGSGVVIYKIGEEATRHGVYVNGFLNQGFAMEKKGPGIYGAFIGLAFDQDKVEEAHVAAVDEAGNEGRAGFGMIVRRSDFRKDRSINVGDGFLQLKLPEFRNHYPEMAGEEVDQYVFVNSTVRQKNKQQILDICKLSAPERFWEGRFLRMGRSSTQARYADQRTYYYKGKKIDRQVHLGIDLASTKQAEVEAANSGQVVFVGYLGIYGNTVIIDHGQGLFSLYSHLSQIATASDYMVNKGEVIGLTGNTGMAGGDHLHFSMLVNGLFVSPLEWWDENWLQLNIEGKI